MLKTETYIINLDKLMDNKDELTSFNDFYNSKKNECNLQIIFISYKPAINCDEFEQWIFVGLPFSDVVPVQAGTIFKLCPSPERAYKFNKIKSAFLTAKVLSISLGCSSNFCFKIFFCKISKFKEEKLNLSVRCITYFASLKYNWGF